MKQQLCSAGTSFMYLEFSAIAGLRNWVCCSPTLNAAMKVWLRLWSSAPWKTRLSSTVWTTSVSIGRWWNRTSGRPWPTGCQVSLALVWPPLQASVHWMVNSVFHMSAVFFFLYLMFSQSFVGNLGWFVVQILGWSFRRKFGWSFVEIWVDSFVGNLGWSFCGKFGLILCRKFWLICLYEIWVGPSWEIWVGPLQCLCFNIRKMGWSDSLRLERSFESRLSISNTLLFRWLLPKLLPQALWCQRGLPLMQTGWPLLPRFPHGDAVLSDGGH